MAVEIKKGDALGVLKARRIDLAIVDVHMPIMNGVELIRTIRGDAMLETLPVIDDHGHHHHH